MLSELKKQIALEISSSTQIDLATIENLLETPKNTDHGQLAMPVFTLAKELKKAPPQIASEVASQIKNCDNDLIQAANGAGGFVNIEIFPKVIQSFVEKTILESKDPAAKVQTDSKRVIIDYSSPNVAKPLGIGHLRATVIGQALRNIAEKQGYEVTGLNYLGDWGVQFGKLAWAFLHWGDEYDFENNPFESLYEMYVRFHAEEESDEELRSKGAEYFQKLERGDEQITSLWKKFIDITMKEHEKIYSLLGVKFDLVQGESFYNDKLDQAVEKIKEAGILEKSEGADVVFLEGMDAPCLIRKSDGSSLYATRDVASAMYRHGEMNGDELLYVVGADQSLHFKQVFGVLEKMGLDWSKTCHHIAFGLYRFKDTKMSTRKGNVIFMADVLKKATDLALEIIEKKNPDLEGKELVAQQVGVGAIVFNDLSNDRVKNVDFDWDRVLDFEGDSGPYVQYCLVRCRSLIRKYGKPITNNFLKPLDQDAEIKLMMTLLSYDEVIEGAWRLYKPNIVVQYLLKLCQEFSHFYHSCRVLSDDEEKTKDRMTLVLATEVILTDALSILGVPQPEQM